jgi:hypothetical protein
MQQLRDITDTQDDVRLGIATFTVPTATDILTYTLTDVVTDADDNKGNAVDDETSLLCCVRNNIMGLIWELKIATFMTILHMIGSAIFGIKVMKTETLMAMKVISQQVVF